MIIFEKETGYTVQGIYVGTGAALTMGERGDADTLAEGASNDESIIEAGIPIRDFRANRRIPRYPLEVVQNVFGQYQPEVGLNHMDLARENLPATGEDMKALIDRVSRWLD